jgi:hypothetical protein
MALSFFIIFNMVSGVRCQVSGTCFKLLARRLESWEARKPEAMTFLSLLTSKLPSLPAILLTPETFVI